MKEEIEKFAAECRDCHEACRTTPVWEGADLNGADLSGANLSYANLRGVSLRGANLIGANLIGAALHRTDLSGAALNGAVIAEGVVVAYAARENGGYNWHALRTAEGVTVLHYGCERHPLATWQSRGPEYGLRHDHDKDHWAVGPAVAIAAAEALAKENTCPG